MRTLFSIPGKQMYLADKERLLFSIDGNIYDINGSKVPSDGFTKKTQKYDGWYQHWMDYEGLPNPFKSTSTIEPVCEIDDIFGNFGFQNEQGDFVIEPQYAYAHEFTHGLAAVNLNRTWYTAPNGHRYYENHYGYIDGSGKTAIGFQFDEAYPFNKYGVARVSYLTSKWFLIDLQGNEIPGTRFPYISYFEYEDRYIEFSSEDEDDALVGLYDTKNRKILLNPNFEEITVVDDDTFLVTERNGEYGYSDFREHFINRNGEIIFPWLYGKGFAFVRKPDIHNVSAVASSRYTELSGAPRSYFENNGKKYSRDFVYGLYSSNGHFILPQEYEKISRLSDDIWGCYKDGHFTVVRTEEGD